MRTSTPRILAANSAVSIDRSGTKYGDTIHSRFWLWPITSSKAMAQLSSSSAGPVGMISIDWSPAISIELGRSVSSSPVAHCQSSRKLSSAASAAELRP